MNFDCIAYLNANGNTLLTRTAFLPRERIQADAQALEAAHGEKVYATRSFVNSAGDEVATELFTPLSLAKPDMAAARVEYWRPVGPRPPHSQAAEGQYFAKADFALAGILITLDENACTNAYDYLEYPFFRWNPNPHEGMSPSPRVGDIFVVRGARSESLTSDAYFIAGRGFTPINFAV